MRQRRRDGRDRLARGPARRQRALRDDRANPMASSSSNAPPTARSPSVRAPPAASPRPGSKTSTSPGPRDLRGRPRSAGGRRGGRERRRPHVYTSARFGGIDAFDVVAPAGAGTAEGPPADRPAIGQPGLPRRQGQGEEDLRPAEGALEGKRAQGPQGHLRHLRSGERQAERSGGSRPAPGEGHEARPAPGKQDGQAALPLSAAAVQCLGHAHRLGRGRSLRAPIPRAVRDRGRQPAAAGDGAPEAAERGGDRRPRRSGAARAARRRRR